jgi:hypothetical protein
MPVPDRGGIQMAQAPIPKTVSVAVPPGPAPRLLANADSAHDEVLLVAALERIELTRQTLEELLTAELSGLLFL